LAGPPYGRLVAALGVNLKGTALTGAVIRLLDIAFGDAILVSLVILGLGFSGRLDWLLG